MAYSHGTEKGFMLIVYQEGEIALKDLGKTFQWAAKRQRPLGEPHSFFRGNIAQIRTTSSWAILGSNEPVF
jgi:hypothetical protein